MTRTMEIPSELESALQEKTQCFDMSVERYVIKVLRHEAEKSAEMAPFNRQQHVRMLHGKYKKPGSLVDALLQERRVD